MRPPTPWLSAGYRSELDAMAGNLTAVEERAQDRLFVAHCSLDGLRERLPLPWPSPKKTYRSEYAYLGWDDLDDPATWQQSSEFDLLLRLIDYSGLRPVLAQYADPQEPAGSSLCRLCPPPWLPRWPLPR